VRARLGSVVAAALACLALGCARAPSEPDSSTAPWLHWQSPLGREHPLAGRVYDTSAQRFVTPDEAAARASAADFVLLGEKHDNADHHRLQAWLIAEIARDGRRPAVVLEMISRDRSGSLASARAAHPDDADALGVALDWSASGWPEFALYRPVFAAALAADLPLVAGDLTRAELAQLRQGGVDALPQAERDRLALDPPPSAETLRVFSEEVRTAHCGMAPPAMVAAMIGVQRARDASLADALLGAEASDGAVLIAGAGHARREPGVPVYLGRRAPQKPVLVIGFVELPSDPAVAVDPAQAGTGFDLIWYTPRVDDVDACERFKQQLEKMRAPKPAPGG
jgi:uncharacterized iron-regulated protein